MDGEDLANLGAAVKAARLRLPGAPTQGEAAVAAGVSDTTWNLIENGKFVGERSRSKVAAHLGWSDDHLARLLAGEQVADAPVSGTEGVARDELLAAVRELTAVVQELREDLREGRR